MIGLVLAAGAGRRLRPLTDDLPKALVPLDGRRSVLDVTLANFAAVGLTEAVIVVGYRAAAITERLHQWRAATGLRIDVVDNDHAEDRNNAYSLWCAREIIRNGVLIANGDTLHTAQVERLLLEDPVPEAILLAVDSSRPLGDEEMKVACDAGGRVEAISKQLPHDADGEYIGVSLVPRACGVALVDALHRTWTADEHRYYEDAFQLLAGEGTPVEVRRIGDEPWTEIDDHADLQRARELMCRF